MSEAVRSGWRWLPMALVLIGVDQWTKGLVETHFVYGESLPVWFWLDITRLHNPGAAFSFLAAQDGWQVHFLSVLAAVVSVVLVDRLEHGYVVDFVHVHWNAAYFPAFNVADSAITVGAAFLLLDALREWRRERRAGA